MKAADRSPSKQYQLRSTYLVLNRNSGRITLQQNTNDFHVTTPYGYFNGEVTILLRGRYEKRATWSDMRNKRYHKTEETDRSPSKYSVQLTSFLTETLEGSHSNNTRTISRRPYLAATWMRRSLFCYDEETKREAVWSDVIKRYSNGRWCWPAR